MDGQTNQHKETNYKDGWMKKTNKLSTVGWWIDGWMDGQTNKLWMD